MLHLLHYKLTFLLLLGPLSQGIAQFGYYNTTPDSQFSEANKYGTGLGIADMNNDGWKDIVVANGNDMLRDRVQIYYNQGDGTFLTSPGWQSEDIDYHGHLSIGDLDKNGWNDIVVSVYLGESGFGSPGKLKIYYNSEAGMENLPAYISESFYTFSCALGDADNDGDLDIAATGGESYHSINDQGRIFINNNGSFTDSANWKTNDMACSYDVDFADFNQDGYADIVFGNNGFKSRIYLSDSSSGIVANEHSWENAEETLLVNSLDIGFIDTNEFPDIVFSNNNQEGGDGKMKTYLFENEVLPPTTSAAWESDVWNYQSGIYLYDINKDDKLDLITGGWWEPIKIVYGISGGFSNTVEFISESESVVEAIMFSDLGKERTVVIVDTILVTQDSASMFYTSKKPFETLVSIQHNATLLDDGDYCFVPGKNWISTRENVISGDTLILKYTYSPYPDMVVSNWDVQNYIFYNQMDDTVNIQSPAEKTEISIYPNPASYFTKIQIPKSEHSAMVEIIDYSGKKVKAWPNLSQGTHKLSLLNLPAGIYLITVYASNNTYSKKIVIK